MQLLAIALGLQPLAARAAVCGDAVRDAEEVCDLGIGNEVGRECTPACTLPECGDGHVAPHEGCDDGNARAGDGCSPACEREGHPRWVGTFEDSTPGDEALHAVAQTISGFVVAGARTDGWQVSVPIMAGFGPDGTLAWLDTASTDDGPAAASGVLAVDDDAVLVGTTFTASGDRVAWAWRYDSDGQRRYATQVHLPTPGEINDIAVTSGGRALVGGARMLTPQDDVAWLGEIDLEDGQLVWSVDVPLDASHGGSLAALAVDSEGRIAATGHAATLTGWQAWVGRFAPDGEALWASLVAPNDESWSSDFGTGIAVDGEGRIYAVGSRLDGQTESPWGAGVQSNYDIWVGAFTRDGDLRWSDTFAGELGLLELSGGVAIDDQGRPIVSGSVQTQPLLAPAEWDRDAWLRGYEPDGTVRWTQTWDGDLHGSDAADAITITDDGSFVVAGQSSVVFEGPTAMLARFEMPGETEQHHGPAPTSSALPITRLTAAPRPSADGHPTREVEPGRRRGTLFIDFSGGDLRPGVHGNRGETPCLNTELAFPGYGGDRQQAETIAGIVASALSPYGIAVAWEHEPPAHLPFTRVMVGGLAEQIGLPPAAAGYTCVVDCGDTSASDLAFAFDRDTPTVLAETILHEAGHTWGLDHIVDAGHFMSPFGAGVGATWVSSCAPTSDATSTPQCLDFHAIECPDGGQNSHAELLHAFGSAGPDIEPPRVTIRAPRWGDEIVPGRPVRLELAVADDFGGAGHEIVVPSLEWRRSGEGDEADLELALPPGVHDIRVDAIDHSGNTASATVRVGIGEPVFDPRPVPEIDGDAPTPGKDPGEPAADGGCNLGHATASWWYVLLVLTSPFVRRLVRD